MKGLINIKRFQERLLKQAFDNETSCYTLNEYYNDISKVKGLITNPSITNNGNIHFHSDTLFKRGDLVTVNDSYYLIDSDIVRERGIKYKGIGYYCNWNYEIPIIERVIIGYDNYGFPIYDDVIVGYRKEYGILRFRDVSYPSQDSIVQTNPSYDLLVRDTESNRELFALNERIEIGGVGYMVYNQAFDREGILGLRLRLSYS